MVTKRQNLAPVRSGENCSGHGNGKKFITVHQTGNTNKGANAQMHANLQMRVWTASWHWQVDDKEAIQSFPHSVKCWHASDGERGDGNANSIGVEGCINSDGDYKKSVQNMAELVAWIAKEESIPVANIKQHHDFARDNKNCPSQIRAGKEDINWTKFIQMVQAELDKLNGKIAVDSAKAHKVAKGDTLWSISKKYDVTVANLKTWNSLKSDLIVPGQSLNLQATASKPAAKPVAKKTYVQLAAHEPTWRAYKLGATPVVGNEVGFLAPRQYGGLEYEVLGYEDNGTCAIIQTQAFGKVKIFIKDPSAKIVTK